jgi:hypothetical protein
MHYTRDESFYILDAPLVRHGLSQGCQTVAPGHRKDMCENIHQNW